MQQITRGRVLEMCLTLLEAQARIISKDFTLLIPREGYEMAWEELRGAMDVVRGMMREERWGKNDRNET